MYRMIFFRVALATSVASLAVVSGCTWTGSSVSQTIDYQNARTRTTPLEVPPDLSQLPRDERFTVPERPQTVTASSTAAGRPGGPAGAPGAATAAMVAPTPRSLTSSVPAISAGSRSTCRPTRRGRSCLSSGPA